MRDGRTESAGASRSSGPSESSVPAAPALRAIEGGGATNSRPSPPIRTALAGLDTIRQRHRLTEDAYLTLGRHPHQDGPRGARRLSVGGVRVEGFPDGLVTVEARVAHLLDGPDAHYLGGPDQLLDASAAAVHLLGSLGVEGDPDPALGRFDLAADLHYDDPREGLAVLRAAGDVDLPWLKAGIEGRRRGENETVYWRTVQGRSVHLRLYDKGVESGQAPPGTWQRLERQIRDRKSRERSASAVASLDFSALYEGRYLGALLAVPDVVICDRPSAIAELQRLMAAGEITGRTAHALAGFVMLEGEGLARSATYHRWAQLRGLGIALDPHAQGATVVSIASHVRRARAAFQVAA
jgi:hypothetical protein